MDSPRDPRVGSAVPHVAEADIVVVLGSQNSSNSMRLAEIARSFGKPAYLIDGVKEQLRPDLFASWNPIDSRREAEQAEVRLAEALRERGFRVYGGH